MSGTSRGGQRRKKKEEDVEGDEGHIEQATSSKKRRKRAAAEEAPVAQPDAEEAGEASENEEEDDVEAEVDDEEAQDQEEGEEEDDDEDVGPKKVFRPGIDTVEEGEQLDAEPGTYDMLHKAQVEWPCLSFDIMRDDLGAQRSTYPMTAYVVAGTQAMNQEDNRIYVMKWSQLHKTLKDGCEDSDEESEDDCDDDDDDKDAKLEFKTVAHPGGVNRIRSMPQACHIVATWSDSGSVLMWNLESQRKALDRPSDKVPAAPKPIYTCEAHKDEGYAMDWSPHDIGRFLSGGNDKRIFLWEPVKGGWNAGADKPFAGHTASVEDVQWKKKGNSCQYVFASCSADRGVRVWDVRESKRDKSAVHIPDAHGSDVNVLSWSPCVGELLATGADDGGFKIWDTRNTTAGPMANFSWHKKPVTSIDFHPTDETVLAVAADDNSVSLWDMAVEDDAPGGREEAPGAAHYPAQLLFLHMGLKEPKELRWHPQLAGVCLCTALSGFDIFKTCNI